MARIRSIKPEFPQSESMGRVTRDARLLFILLWPICDDHGRTRAASRMLASTLFPYDDDAKDSIDAWLSELERENCIRRYEHNGSAYLEIRNWLNHQKIDKPSKPQFPEPSDSPREDSRIVVVGREGKGEEGKGKEGARGARTLSAWMTELGEQDAIPSDDPIFEYAEKTGIPLGFLELSWKRFVEDMTERGTKKRDWKAHYRNAVRGNWFKLWWFNPDGECKLTTTGEQARRAA